MIERQLTAALVNVVVNHPSVKPWVCGRIDGPLDLTEEIEDGRYIALFGIHGGFLFWRLGSGIYDAHSAVLPTGRGKWALRAARQALDFMFSHDAREIMMAVPHGNDAVRGLVRLLRAKPRGTIENGWWLGGPVDVDIYSITKDDWQCRSPLQ